MIKTMNIILSLILFIFSNFFLTCFANEDDCVICAQFVPMCGEDEKLVPQTCTECAHCEPVESKTRKLNKTKCTNPCGSICCLKGYKCKVVNLCTSKKAPCKPDLRYFCINSTK